MRKTRLLGLVLLLALVLSLGQSAAQSEELGAKIVLAGGEELDWVCGHPFVEPGYTAWDSDGVERTEDVKIKGEVKTWYVGDYTLRYSLTLHEGEKLSVERTVHVCPAPPLPEVQPQEKTIYLTFDDGPSVYTEKVLEILAKYDVKATFFVVTSCAFCEDLVPKIVEGGHTLGLHAHEHNVSYLYRNLDNYFRDVMQGEEELFAITGAYTPFVRMPGGSRSARDLMRNLPGQQAGFEQIMQEMGLRYFDWNVQPETGKNMEGTIYTFTHPKEPYDSAVVLQHDTREFSVLALEEMIVWGLENGYRFAPIDLTTPEVHTQLRFDWG